MLNNPEGSVDFGHRALHVTTRVAKEIVGEYYGWEAGWKYYAGCSTGETHLLWDDGRRECC